VSMCGGNLGRGEGIAATVPVRASAVNRTGVMTELRQG
jgi:hypothetical protein